jgi:hypothetical protein
MTLIKRREKQTSSERVLLAQEEEHVGTCDISPTVTDTEVSALSAEGKRLHDGRDSKYAGHGIPMHSCPQSNLD